VITDLPRCLFISCKVVDNDGVKHVLVNAVRKGVHGELAGLTAFCNTGALRK
jgi:hypothetical protein